MSKLLKPYGILWGSNSRDASGYAFEDGCQIMWPISLYFGKIAIIYCLLGEDWATLIQSESNYGNGTGF